MEKQPWFQFIWLALAFFTKYLCKFFPFSRKTNKTKPEVTKEIQDVIEEVIEEIIEQVTEEPKDEKMEEDDVNKKYQ